jgi:hypothetical protein
MRSTQLCVLGLALITAATACSRAQLGLPRVPVEAASPDGSRLAFVRNHPTIDPPAQSLWLRGADGKETKLRRLADDLGWCHTIVWSGDGTRVAFLVEDAQLVLVDARTDRLVLERWLVHPPGGYPPHRIVRDLLLSQDGSEAAYRLCPRRDPGPCSAALSLELGMPDGGEASRAVTGGWQPNGA